MQLVNDCVVMYDTMKDRRIGIPEVIEKFGVPPEKVIEVQALIGDSTDNVPGVPGIGVKTAAQLIGEYGDLETLLARAGEIKQEKRRQALIENAEQARLSKKLVTLDDHVALDVPLAELAVHEPDYKRLIAFLKAMEFVTLTRRVAEFSGLDAAQIEPDGRLNGGASRAPARRRPLRSSPAASGAAAVRLADAAPPEDGADRDRARPGSDRAAGAVHAAVARRRARRGRAQCQDRPLALRDRAQPRPAQRLDRARARARHGRDRHRDHQPRPDAGGAVRLLARAGAERSLLRAARPPARAATAATAACSPAPSRPIRSRSARRSRR